MSSPVQNLAMLPRSLRLKVEVLTMAHKALHEPVPHDLSDLLSC